MYNFSTNLFTDVKINLSNRSDCQFITIHQSWRLLCRL